jgi:hypothetical protein
LFENEDGPFYSLNPEKTEYGFFAKHFYPATERRSVSGYLDSERYFLNTLLEVKHSKGIGKRCKFEYASWTDVSKVMRRLSAKALALERYDKHAAAHVASEMIPLVYAYVTALRRAKYSPSYFFDPKFSVDTGSICNMGGAYREFKGLASRPEMALTPDHKRIYGENSFFANEGVVWRIFPTLFPKPSLAVEKQDLRKRTDKDKGISERYFVEIGGLEKRNFDDSIKQMKFITPGQVAADKEDKEKNCVEEILCP